MSEPNEMDESRVEVVSDTEANEANETGAAGGLSRAEAPERTYTADEVRAMIQSESDRRVSGARARWERDLDERIGLEAERRAAELTASYAQRVAGLESDLAEAKAQSERRERRLAIIAALEGAGLGTDLLPMVEGVESGSEAQAIAALKNAIEEKVAAECARRVVMKPPAAGSAKPKLTSSEILSLPVAQLSRLMKD